MQTTPAGGSGGRVQPPALPPSNAASASGGRELRAGDRITIPSATPGYEATHTAAPDDTATDRASAETAARELHAYIMRTSSSTRDRTRIRTLQSAIGVTPDGLIGRETAARIKALTGLRIPGLS